MTFGVRSLPVGRADIPGPELFWMAQWDRWFPLTFQSVLIQGQNITALVNTGPGRDLTAMNELWVKILGERAPMRREDDEFITGALARAEVRPEDVTHLFLTPLQLYSTANVPLFTNAQICLAKRGWVHYHTSHNHPHDVRWNCIPRDVLVHMVTDAWDRVRLLDDEDEIAPGLRTWWAGTHHRATMAVDVDTPDGTVVISDAFFYYENVEENRILGSNENMYSELGPIQVLVSNAGICPFRDFFDISEELWDQVLEVNLKGAFLCARGVSRILVDRGLPGKFVFLSSISAWAGGAQQVHYCTTKAGISSLVRSLAIVLGPHDINCNAVLPGAIYTDMNKDDLPPGSEKRAYFESRIPLGRVGEPTDIADVISFLCSDDARYMNGSEVLVDGGMFVNLQ